MLAQRGQRGRITSDCDAVSSSGWLPWRVIAKHGVQGSNDFTDACGQSDFLVLAGSEQPFVEELDVRIEADRHHRAQE
jgi:hypothetical protein